MYSRSDLIIISPKYIFTNDTKQDLHFMEIDTESPKEIKSKQEVQIF